MLLFPRASWVFLAASLASGVPSRAAEPPPLHATLRTWADDAWFKALDRNGAADGRLSAKGILQRFHRLTDDEYKLDFVSKDYTLLEDYLWHRRSRGLRYATGSVNPRDLAEALDFKVLLPMGRGWSFDAWFTRDRSVHLDRNLLRVAVDRRWASGCFARALGTLGAVKPDSDLELGGGWRSEDERSEVLVAAVLLDAFNDLIYQELTIHPDYADTALDYERQPMALRAEVDVFVTPRLRLEAYGAITREAVVRAYEQRDPAMGFRQSEAYGFAGALVEWAFSNDAAAGLTVSHVAAGLDREPLPGAPVEETFSLREQETRWGGFALLRLHPRWRLESWALRELRPETRDAPDSSALHDVDYEDRSWMGLVQLVHGGEGGFAGGLAVDFDLRDTLRGDGEIPIRFQGLGYHNVRLRADVGWRFEGRGYVLAGASFDLDGDPQNERRRFDGARARFELFF